MSSKKQYDALGTRMKVFEGLYTSSKLIPGLPVIVRLDGRSFSKFTKRMSRPYDERMSCLMEETTKYLVKEFNATLGYVQSDEISLVLNNTYENPCIFNGKLQKMVSVIAASCTAYFNSNFTKYFEDTSSTDFSERLPTFDCRVFNVPSEDEATNCILWRYLDAIKNSKQMLGQHYFSHKELQNLSGNKIVDKLLIEKQIDWKAYPDFFREGLFIKKINYPVDVDVIRSKVVTIKQKVLFNTLEHSSRLKFVMDDTFND